MTLQTFFITLIQFINGIIIPFLIGVAFLLLLVNVIRFFIIGGSNADSQEKARSLALYSLLAFVFLLVFWGIVNLLAASFGLAGCDMPTSDYMDLSTGIFIDPCAGSGFGMPGDPGFPDGMTVPDTVPVS